MRPLRTTAAFLFLVGAALAHAQAPRLSNIATRGPVGTGADIMIAGLVIGPGDPETVLIRAVGPSLVPFNVTGVLAEPVLSLFDSSGTLIQSNQGWGNGNATAAVMASVGAFPLITGSADSALVATLPAGSYSAEVSGLDGTTGVALLEVYEVGASATTARLVNLSTRGEVGTSGNIMIPGITIGAGSGERTLLIRAAGPALGALNVPGALADPTMSVVDSSGNVVASNDNWGTPIGGGSDAAALSAAFTQAGAFAFAVGSLDSALIATVPPGAYSVLVSGNAGSTGVALAEVYDITPPSQTGSGPDVVTIAATDASADTSGGNTGTFTFSRTGDTTSAIVVNYSVGGSAVNGTDFQYLNGSVTIPAGESSAQVTVAPNPTLSQASTMTVVANLAAGASYSVGPDNSATVAIQIIAPTLYVAQIRPSSGAPGSAGSGVATILVSSDGSLASVSVTFSNLSSGEDAAQLELGGDTGNGTTLIDFPAGQILNLSWTPTGEGQYTTAQVMAALASGNVFVEIDSSTYPSGELGGQFIVSTGSQVFSPPPPPPAIDLSSVPPADAPRFLTQATFGPTAADIGSLESMGYSAWIANQMALPETSHRAATDADAAAFPPTGTFAVTQNNRQAAWWLISVAAPDQLRQRVAFALSEIFVTSDVASQLANQADGARQLLRPTGEGRVRQLPHAAAGRDAQPGDGQLPQHAPQRQGERRQGDERRRELRPRGPAALHDRAERAAARRDAHAGRDRPAHPDLRPGGDRPDCECVHRLGLQFHRRQPELLRGGGRLRRPHDAVPRVPRRVAEDRGQRDRPPGEPGRRRGPEGGTGRPLQPPEHGAVPLLAADPAPGDQQPQPGAMSTESRRSSRTTAPAPAATWRAVVRAILLDYEARSPALLGHAGYGKLKEPLLRMTALYRAFGASAQDGRFAILNAQVALGEAALRSPTVFNFFDPGYVQPGTLASAGLFAPEFQITTATTADQRAEQHLLGHLHARHADGHDDRPRPFAAHRERLQSDRDGRHAEPAPVRRRHERPDAAADPLGPCRASRRHCPPQPPPRWPSTSP